MSHELVEISEQIDEQFEIEDIDTESDDFWEALVNLFIWAESWKRKDQSFIRAVKAFSLSLSAFSF